MEKAESDSDQVMPANDLIGCSDQVTPVTNLIGCADQPSAATDLIGCADPVTPVTDLIGCAVDAYCRCGALLKDVDTIEECNLIQTVTEVVDIFSSDEKTEVSHYCLKTTTHLKLFHCWICLPLEMYESYKSYTKL